MTDRDLILLICAGVIGLAALLRAGSYIAKGVVQLVHKIDRINKAVDQIDEVTQQELTSNDGTSIKDDVYGMAYSIGELQRNQDDERKRFNAALALAAQHHPEDAEMYLALKRQK